MRISSLVLEAYGHFSNRLIDLSPDVDLTVVHGGNEAGKSTALQAVTDLLYGIPVRSDYGWHHGTKAMSIAGKFVVDGGTELAVRRLKRQARTLVNMSNEPLPDDTLQAILKGRSRATFEEVFGLDQNRLRAGGRRLLEGNGDLADSLVAASPGLANVLSIRDKLNGDAAKAHNHQRKNTGTLLGQATAARDVARKAVRDSEVRADEVKHVRREVEEADAARKSAVEAEAYARMEVARLDRLQRAAAELSAYDRLAASRATLEPLPLADAQVAAAARAAIVALGEARRIDKGCRDELAAAEEALSAIKVDAGLLDAAVSIEAMDERRAVVEDAMTNLPKRLDEASAMRGTVARLASALGLGSADDLRSRLPGDPILARADRLVDDMRKEETTRAEIVGALASLESARAKVQGELTRLGEVQDPTAFRQRLDTLDGCEERAEAAKRARAASAAEAKRLDALVTRLSFGVSDLETLAARPLPSVARANAAAKRLAEAEAELEKSLVAETTAIDEEARLRAKVEAIKAPGEVPTASAIEGVRQSRDATWASMRPALLAERPVTEEDAKAVLDFDGSMPHADRLADERWAGSARAADLLQAEVALGEAVAGTKGAAARVVERRRGADEALAAWGALWRDLGIDSSEPADLIERLRKAFDLVAQTDRVAELKEDEGVRVAASDMDGKRVDKLAADLGLDEGNASVGDIRSAVATMQTRFQERRDFDRDLRNNEHALVDLNSRQRTVDGQAKAIGIEAAEILPALSIRNGAASGEVKAALGIWRDAKGLLPSLEQLEHRIERIEENRVEFEAKARDIIRSVAPDIGMDDALLGIRQLRTRVVAARQAGSRAEDAGLNLARRQAACERSSATLRKALDEFAALRVRLGADTEGDLLPLIERIDEALSIDGEMRKARPRVDEALADRNEAEVRAELGNNDAVALVGMKAKAESAASAASAQVAAVIERHVMARTATAAIEARDGAANAAQDEQDAIAAMAGAAESFVRNHVAGKLLSAAIDRYRERHQSPIVARASAAFATLTGNRWEGIGIDYGEEQPVLKPIRNGELHDLKALSEGTADQLFLALRIAAIEEHAAASTPLPFILDDLFTAFDEPRTEAGLSLLADLGRTTQVLLFTHHEHVVVGAQRALGDRVDIVRL